MAQLSDSLLFVAVLVYAVAMLAFAADAASRRANRLLALSEHGVLVGAGGPSVEMSVPPPTHSGYAGTAAVALTLLGWIAHVGSVVTRGLAVDRVPWGNMYEFSTAAALVAVTGFLVLVLRGRVETSLGAFVMLPVVLYLGLAGTVLYTKAGPLVPALNSYWIKIHVAAAATASGAFLLSGVIALLYLLRDRFDARNDVGEPVRFPVWTFAIIAGAIWAEAAWGRYWGWDPKETWSFITWVLYAGYLHARATAGWKGRKAAWVAVAAAGALIIDYYVVNIFVVGLHSYA